MCVQLQPDATAYNATFSACAQGQRWQKALELLGVEGPTVAEGPGMLDEMAGQRCHRQRHNQRLWKGQRWQKAWDCRTEGAVPSCSPRCQLQCHSQRMQEGQRWQQALEVLDEMRGSMLQHNVVTYIATISA